MTHTRIALPAALVLLALAAPVGAHGATFGPAQALNLPVSGPLAATVGPGGEAVVAGVRGAPGNSHVEVAMRTGRGAPWVVHAVGPVAPEIRDVQTVIGHGRAVVAWAEIRRRANAVLVATGPVGGALTVRQRFPVADAFAASPRLARLSGGRVVVAWRDGKFRAPSRVRVATISRDHFETGPRTAGTDAATIVLTARGAGAAVGWTSTFRARKGAGPARRALPRTLTIRALDSGGVPTGAATIAGRDVGTIARLAGAPDGRLVASWVRPQQTAASPSATVAPLAFTRQILPRLLPARPLGGPNQIAGGPPSVAFDGADHAVAALRVSAPAVGPAFDAVVADSRAGAPWSTPRLVAHLGFTRMDPVAAAPVAGDVVLVYTAIAGFNGPPAWAVVATDAAGTHGLGTTTGSDGRGVTVARAPGRVLVAWLDAGRVQVAERV
jgi:hypothetical protein